MVGPFSFRFLNRTHSLTESRGWEDLDSEKLWLYNLHYFDDLNADNAQERTRWHRDLINRWILENEPGEGTGWEPYPTSLRIVNWIKWSLAGNPLEPEWLHSLAIQARWLRRRVEWHLLGNHIFSNAKALVFAGLFFSGPEAAKWLSTGLRILEREMPNQILPDGAHFELSPMYHALIFEDMLDLSNLARVYPNDDKTLESAQGKMHDHLSPMLFWLRCMTHSRGTLAHFNDTADGIAPANTEIERYARDLGIEAPYPPTVGTTWFKHSGYVRLASSPTTVIVDVGHVGPDYLLAHAHADTLSFELSVGRELVVVNGGVSCYEKSAQRHLERGTASHSTVQIGDHDSSEVWNSFRVGRRAKPFDVTVDDCKVTASHNGYRHLSGSPTHKRMWTVDGDSLIVEDWVAPSQEIATARFHFAPVLTLQPFADSGWEIVSQTKKIAIIRVDEGEGVLTNSQFAPEFGKKVSTCCLRVRLTHGRAKTVISWNP
tara:strand:+ start:8788 stop:10251 length:1464 start_codon:yes stop_codon:yes gene_type:complete